MVSENIENVCKVLGITIPHSDTMSLHTRTLYEHLIMALGDEVVIKRWMQAPNEALNDSAPASYTDNEQNIQKVIKQVRLMLEQDSRIG